MVGRMGTSHTEEAQVFFLCGFVAFLKMLLLVA